MIDYTILTLGTILGVAGAIVGISWAKYRTLAPNLVKKRIDLSDSLISDYEQEIKYWRGKANQAKQINKVEFDGDLSDEGQIVNLIKDILPNVSHALPRELRSLVNDPAAVDLAFKLYKANPERAKQFLQGLIKSKGSKGESTSSNSYADFEKQVVG